MVFFINIYGRATDPPDKDKGNQIGGGGGDNDINRNRYADTHNKVGDCRTHSIPVSGDIGLWGLPVIGKGE